MPRTQIYEKPSVVEDDSSTEIDSEDTGDPASSLLARQMRHGILSERSRWMKPLTLAAAAVFMVVVICLAGLGLYYIVAIDQVCVMRVTNYSPGLLELHPKFFDVRFNGTLDWPSEYRGDPSPEIDEAWAKLENVKVMSVSEEDLAKSGSDLDSVRIPEEFGGGYMASLEVNHQLHCLNFLRKATHWDYYQFKSVEFTDEPKMIRVHLDHCIEMLRQNLMCNADVGIISHRWVENYYRPYPNFNVLHKCRDFNEVLDYAYDHQVPTPPSYRYHPQSFEKQFPSPP